MIAVSQNFLITNYKCEVLLPLQNQNMVNSLLLCLTSIPGRNIRLQWKKFIPMKNYFEGLLDTILLFIPIHLCSIIEDCGLLAILWLIFSSICAPRLVSPSFFPLSSYQYLSFARCASLRGGELDV